MPMSFSINMLIFPF